MRAGPFSRDAIRTFPLQAKDMRTSDAPRVGKRNKPREGVGGSNCIANGHLGFQRVATRRDGEHKTHGKWGHRRRQLI